MAPRRRAVERATIRRTVVDRLVVLVLVVLAASGLMSILPSQSQVAVSRLGCRAVSLGLGACGAPGLDLQDTQLTESRCAALSTLDTVLPEVRVRELTAAQALPVVISTERSGDMFVQLGPLGQLGPPGQLAPPALLEGEARASTDVSGGVSVPLEAEWYLPRGQGLEQLVVAVQDGHHLDVQRRSALALVSRMLGRRAREVPPPSVLYSQVRLDGSLWPRSLDRPAPPPQRAGGPDRTRVPTATSSSVTVSTSTPASSTYNRVTHESAVVASLTGRLGQQPVTGAVRWTRDAQGAVTSVLVAVVAPGRLAPGEPGASLPGPGVAYLSIPVSTAPEQALVESWFAGPGPLTIPLDELLGLRVPPAGDQLGSFLTRAATITILRYGLVEPGELQQRVSAELRGLRRQEWEGVRMVGAGTIAPQPTGVGRKVLADPGCRT